MLVGIAMDDDRWSVVGLIVSNAMRYLMAALLAFGTLWAVSCFTSPPV